MKLGENIREFRTKLRLTQEQLAESVGVTAQAVSKWEREESMPDVTLIPAIADALDVSADELFGHERVTKNSVMRSLNCYLQEADYWREMPHILLTSVIGGLCRKHFFHYGIPEWREGERHNCDEFSKDGIVKFTANPDFPYFVFAPNTGDGYKHLFDGDERVCEKLDALSDESTVCALRWLYQHKKWYRFELPVLLAQTGISPDEAEKVLGNLVKLRVITCEDIDFDGKVRKICSYFPREDLILVWMILYDFITNNSSFEYQSQSGADCIIKPE